MNRLLWSRRKLMGVSLLALAAGSTTAWARSQPIMVYRDPSCGCCGGWVDHLRQSGYAVTVDERSDLDPIKRQLGVPAELWACHTASVAGYAVEGHVPAHALTRLLAERPTLKGLAVPGMPIGSPGMEGGREEIYEVVGFAGPNRVSFGRYRGSQPA
jgi:hypothetical protein